MTLNEVHEQMTERQLVRLRDGRVGKITAIVTDHPAAKTTVSVWVIGDGPVEVDLDELEPERLQ